MANTENTRPMDTSPALELPGPITLRRNENGTIAIIGHVPWVVQMSREFITDLIFEFNETLSQRDEARASLREVEDR